MWRYTLPLIALGTPVFAQDDRDPGFLAGLIEDSVSAPGLSVQIDGFEGAFSSEASIEELRISDDDGTWLVARDLVLDWNRSALLRGRLEVAALTADFIRLERPPLPAEGIEPPEAAASGFALPDLPVSINIADLSAERIELGEAVLGQDTVLTLEASAALADGSGETTITAQRLDGPLGVFSISASYTAGEVAELTLDLDAREAAGGLAASLLDLPDTPALELTLQGGGPLDDFAADFRLNSDGVERLGGRISLTGVDTGRRFDVDLSGDVTPLFAPDLQPFFGDDISLLASGVQGADGSLALDRLDLRTEALTLGGQVRLDADGWPALLDVNGVLATQTGDPVRLPTSDPITLARGRFQLAHDASVGEDWRLDLDLTDLTHPTLELGTGQISATGVIARDGGNVTEATAAILGSMRGMVFSDPALAEAVGPLANVSGTLRWQQDAPTTLRDLRVNAAGLVLTGQAAVLESTAEGVGLPLSLDLSAEVDRLGRFARIAGQPLSGAGNLTVQGALDPLAGTFDLRLAGATQDLAIGIAQADPLLSGRTDLNLAARRSLQGTFVDTLRVENTQLSLDATAAIYGEESEARTDGATGEATLSARINDGSPIDPRLNGPITLQADLDQTSAGIWSGLVDATAPNGVTLDAAGRLTGPNPDVALTVNVPEVAAFADGIPGSAQLQGRAFATDGIWSIEADAALPWDLTASLSGPVTGDFPNLTFDARLPDLTQPVPALADIPPLATGVNLQGTLSARDGIWSINAQSQTGTGIEARVSGPVTGALDLAYSARLPEIEAFSPALEGRAPLNGAATLEGTLRQGVSALEVAARLQTDGGLTASVSGPLTGEAPRLAVTADLPDLSAIDPAISELDPLKGRATVEGTLSQSDGIWSTDLSLAAPSDITARILGDLTGSAAPDLALAATVPDVGVFTTAVQGTLSVDATLRQTTEGLAIAARANGPQEARATVETVLTDALVADFTLTVPQLAPLAPVPGGLDVTGQARQIEGGFDVDLGGTGPYATRFTAKVNTADTLSIAAQGQLPDARAIAPQLNGPVDFDVTATQAGAEWRVNAIVDGAQAISARVNGIATGPNADMTFEANLGNVAAFAPGLSGPLRSSGSFRAQPGGYGFDVVASGPLGADLTASGQLLDGVPSARFDLSVPDIGPLVPDLSGPLRATGSAAQQGDAFAVDVDLTGPGGTTATVSGTAGTTLALAISGQAPLGLTNAFIAPNRLSGTAQFNLRADGAPGLDAVSGTITTAGAALSLPELRNSFDQINAEVGLSGGQAQINLSAELVSGGNLTVAGPVTLSAPFNGNLALRFDGQVEDPALYTVRVISELQLSGPLTGGASVSGDILLDEAEISVPSSGLTAVGALPPIRHVGASGAVQRTLQRAGQTGDAASGRVTGGTRGGPAYPLNITIRAPNRIFIRGRGLDAELGGTLDLRGTSANPLITGGFELVRGRLDILQQRFQLDEGSVTFQGTLDPFIRLVAETNTDALTASIVVEGPASAPEVRFESSPSVPQEEILAQIFFGRDLASLSPLQALQLANSVATLAGRGNGGLLETLRGNAGLDDLDLTTDAEGNTAIRAGKYISDNVYTDVQIDQTGEPRVSLNIDLTPNLTVRGATGATGDTSIGLFFEKDY